MARKRTNLTGNTPSVRETKVAIYIRVSTIHQVDKDSIPMQKKDLIAYCQLILGTDNYEIFEETGYPEIYWTLRKCMRSCVRYV